MKNALGIHCNYDSVFDLYFVLDQFHNMYHICVYAGHILFQLLYRHCLDFVVIFPKPFTIEILFDTLFSYLPIAHFSRIVQRKESS